MTHEILDACCGGRMWWWDKAHPLAIYMDKRVSPKGSKPTRPGWSCIPDVVGDFRAMPFKDDSFHLVLFDPPHVVKRNPTGETEMTYGSLHPDVEQEDLRRGFAECWRVLAPGGTLVCKWAGPIDRVRPHFPATPIVGTRATPRKNHGAWRGAGQGTRWFVFYKPMGEAIAGELAA